MGDLGANWPGSLPTREEGPTPQERPPKGSEVSFLGDVGPSAPFPVRNGREEASGEHKSSNRSGSAKSLGLPENPDQHVHHLLAPAAAILTVLPFPQVL